MSKINTVLGPISPEQLGTTLVHEHCLIGFSGWECDPLPGGQSRAEMIEACVQALVPARDLGLRSIIDATPPDLGRDVEILKAVSERAEIQIICSTGRYTEEYGKWAYLKQRDRLGACGLQAELYDAFLYEITVGIGRSGVRAGAIKVATSQNKMTPCEEAVLAAAARASGETGVPIITHTEGGTLGPEQARFLLAEGAKPERIMIGHMCDNLGSDGQGDQQAILKAGASIAYDRFGLEIYVKDEQRIEALAGLVGEGYGDKIMVSHDYVGASLGRGGLWPNRLPEQL
ncbi:MAG: phosphotriesterase-related protein, partial [Deltaproteobacteria bacterium]|nr:phosphotriesterase-related protein [Deltaproteobacteria bacterium]